MIDAKVETIYVNVGDVRIESDKPVNGFRVWIDGEEITRLRRVVLTLAMNEAPIVEIQRLALPPRK